MTKYMDSKKMRRGRHGWLDSHFHFSFAEYYNPDNVRFGIFRVLNDDIVQASEFSYKNSMSNAHTLTWGQSQYMSAGTKNIVYERIKENGL